MEGLLLDREISYAPGISPQSSQYLHVVHCRVTRHKNRYNVHVSKKAIFELAYVARQHSFMLLSRPIWRKVIENR